MLILTVYFMISAEIPLQFFFWKKNAHHPVCGSQAWVWPILYNVVQALWTQSSRCSENVSNGYKIRVHTFDILPSRENQKPAPCTMRLGQGKPKERCGDHWGWKRHSCPVYCDRYLIMFPRLLSAEVYKHGLYETVYRLCWSMHDHFSWNPGN